MKDIRLALVLLLAFRASSPALPLQTAPIPEEAKWVVHLDLDTFRDSKLGQMVIQGMLQAPLSQLKAQFKVDGELILQKLHSLTAFGTDFEAGSKVNGVLLLKGDEELRQIVEGFLAAQILQDTNGPVQKLQDRPFPLYSVNHEFFVCPGLAGQMLVSKSRKQIETARKTLIAGDRKSTAGDTLWGYAKVPDTFFFLALAQGFNESSALPPQAKILKMADGARIVIGEKAESLFLNLALQAKSAEVSEQIRQVLDGMKALVALGQSDNKELVELVQATQVAASEKMVTVNIEYPWSKAARRLEGMSKHSKGPGESRRPKRAKPDSESSPSE